MSEVAPVSLTSLAVPLQPKPFTIALYDEPLAEFAAREVKEHVFATLEEWQALIPKNLSVGDRVPHNEDFKQRKLARLSFIIRPGNAAPFSAPMPARMQSGRTILAKQHDD